MIQSHTSSLRDVTFTTKNIAVDFRPIFRSLQHVAHLRAIHLSFPFGPFVTSFGFISLSCDYFDRC